MIYVPIANNRMIYGYTWLKKRFFQAVDYDLVNQIQHFNNLNDLVDKVKKAGFLVETIENANGPFGQIAYEITSLTLFIIQRFNAFVGIISTLIYTALYPLVALLMGIDFLSAKKSGNSVFLTARKCN